MSFWAATSVWSDVIWICVNPTAVGPRFSSSLWAARKKLGDPDLTIFFTSTMSHKMVQSALRELKSCDTVIERCHTSSLSALRNILEKHAG